MSKIIVGFVEPVVARWIEHVEIERVFESPGFMRHIRRDTKNFAGADDDFLAIDGEFQRAFEDVGELFIVMVVERDMTAFLEEDPRQHDLLAVNHFAVDVRVEMLALDVFPGDVFGFECA